MYIPPSNSIAMRGVRSSELVTGTPAAGNSKPTPGEAASSFGELFSNSLQTVNDLQSNADELSAQLARGELQDVSTAMVAMQKAQLALDLTTEVRNKLIDAYREIMRMPV